MQYVHHVRRFCIKFHCRGLPDGARHVLAGSVCMVAYPMQQMAAFRRTEKRQSYGLRIKACSVGMNTHKPKRTGSLKLNQSQLMSVCYDKSCQLLCNALLSASPSLVLLLPAVGFAIFRTQLPALLGWHLRLCTILTGLLEMCCANIHVRSQRLFLFCNLTFCILKRVMSTSCTGGRVRLDITSALGEQCQHRGS